MVTLLAWRQRAAPSPTPPCSGCVAPGGGTYYRNDTPIYIPKESKLDYAPHGTGGLLAHVLAVFGDPVRSDILIAAFGLQVKGWWNAYNNLQHWLNDTGTPYRISPAAMLRDLPQFSKKVLLLINTGVRKGGSFDSGWLSDEVSSQLGSFDTPLM